MENKQENFATKARSTGRRLIDGLFGNRNTRQQQEEEQQQLLQEYARLAEEREDKLHFIDSISRRAAIPASHLIEILNKLVHEEEQSDPQSLYAAMMDDAEQLSALIQQLQQTDEARKSDIKEEDSSTLTPTLSSTARQRPLLVLATSDEETGRRIRSEIGNDFEIHKCRNGWQALAEVYRNGADIILAEAEMDVMSGLTMCSRLRSNPQTSLIPVILMTDNDEQHAQALQHGADAYIARTDKTDIIACSVNNLLKGRRQIQLNYEQQRRAEQHEMPEVKRKSANEKLMERIMNTIYKNLKDSSLTVDMIAEEVGMSRVHLHRKMKEIVGQTPHDFIRQLRLEQAARLLATGDMNITEVLYACGFSNAASFSTTFKNIYGMTPTEYMMEKQKATGL